MQPTRILFLCWGNICRSPTAEAILRRQVDAAGLAGTVEVDSAGVSAEHEGSPPDRRARKEAARRGYDLADQRARRVRGDDWDRFDRLLVADTAVERALRRQAPPGADLAKVARITAFVRPDGTRPDGTRPDGTGPAGPVPDEVPDPYYGGADGFTEVFELLDRACAGLLTDLQRAG